MKDAIATTVDGKREDAWDTIRKGLPVILVDEKNQVGIGKERKGRASDTFSVVATVSTDPSALLEIYRENDPGRDKHGRRIELKFKKGAEDTARIIDGLLRAGAEFFAVTVMKRDPDLPSDYSPLKGRDTQRRMAADVVLDAMTNVDAEAVNIYFDEHSAYRGDVLKRIAEEAAKASGKKVGEVRMLNSRNEPLLQLCDFPAGIVGEHIETCPVPPDMAFERMAHRLYHVVIGKGRKGAEGK